jgi:hypothetical protein
MTGNHDPNKLDTTLGDLIEAVSEVAFEYSDNAGEAYLLARLALVEILKTASYRTDTNLPSHDKLPKKTYLH